MDAAPDVDKLEKDFIESTNKIKTLCETISRLESKLENANSQLEIFSRKCEQLSKENEQLRGIEDDLSKQVFILK